MDFNCQQQSDVTSRARACPQRLHLLTVVDRVSTPVARSPCAAPARATRTSPCTTGTTFQCTQSVFSRHEQWIVSRLSTKFQPQVQTCSTTMQKRVNVIASLISNQRTTCARPISVSLHVHMWTWCWYTRGRSECTHRGRFERTHGTRTCHCHGRRQTLRHLLRQCLQERTDRKRQLSTFF